MTTIAQTAQTMQTVLTDVADKAARTTGFVQRQSKLTGAKFCQTLVFGWLANPQATLEELSQTAAVVGVEISAQGLEQRFSRVAAACLQEVLAETIKQVVVCDPVCVPILRRFNGVYIQDGSTLNLPASLAEVWQGCGGKAGQGLAALKLQVRLDMVTGRLDGPFLQAGRAQDRQAPLQRAALPAGALRIADLGYWCLTVLADLDRAGVYWLSRLQAQTVVYDMHDHRWEVSDLLEAQGSAKVDIAVQLGVSQRLPARLVAVRMPQQVADARRMRLKAEARHKGQTVSQTRLKWADWDIFVTNVPVELLTLDEALVLVRIRWQIELIFKLWKSHSHLDEWRSDKPWRILCEVYAKLIAVVMQHWLFLVGCWQYPNRSLFKAAQTVQKHAWHMAASLGCQDQLQAALSVVERCLALGCRINKRKTVPHTYQCLLALTDGGLG